MEVQRKQYRYKAVYSVIKDSILSGEYPLGHFLPPESELSRQFNVDRSTLRKALSMLASDQLIKKEAGLGSRVIYEHQASSDAAKRHEPSPVSVSQRFIGFFVSKADLINSECEQPYYSNLFYELELQCKQRNLQVIYCTLDSNQDFEAAIERNSLSGIIFVSTVPDYYINQATIRKIPFVIINNVTSTGTCIMCNHLEGARLVMQYLYDMGHSRIAIIRGELGYASDTYKMAGCLVSAHEHGKTLDVSLIAHGNWEYKSGYQGAKAIFSRPSPPSAIFCFNDIMALGAIKALREMGYSIGKDVSVVGFDNMRQLEFSEPDLTTVDCNVSHVAQLAIEHLLMAISTDTFCAPQTILVPVALVEGNTVVAVD